MHAVVVEAIRQRPSRRPDDDAHEVLDRLRSVGLPIPARGETTDQYLEGLAEEAAPPGSPPQNRHWPA